MEHVVRIVNHGRTVATFYAEPDPPLTFWRVDIAGRETWHSAMRVTGREPPAFFHRLLAAAPDAP